MSLRNKIKQIAISTVKGYVNTLNLITQNQSQNTYNLQGSVLSFDGTNFQIQMSDGTIQSVPPGGTRPLAIGDCVIVSNGVIVG